MNILTSLNGDLDTMSGNLTELKSIPLQALRLFGDIVATGLQLATVLCKESLRFFDATISSTRWTSHTVVATRLVVSLRAPAMTSIFRCSQVQALALHLENYNTTLGLVLQMVDL
jgi:hypothetical protein